MHDEALKVFEIPDTLQSHFDSICSDRGDDLTTKFQFKKSIATPPKIIATPKPQKDKKTKKEEKIYLTILILNC